MAIADTISSMYENVGEVYDTITNVEVNNGTNLLDYSTCKIGDLNTGTGAEETSTVRIISDFVEVTPNENYICTLIGGDYTTYYYKSDKTFISGGSSWIGSGNSFTTPNNTGYLRLKFKNTNNTTISLNDLSNVMLNKGSTALPYQPYTDNPTYKNIENIPKVIRNSYLEIMNNGIDKIWNNWDKVTGEGETLTLNSTEEAPMKINLKGNTSQEGTPTPEAPQDIHVVSGDNNIKVEGKNLIPTSDIISTSGTISNGVTFTRNSDGSITANGTATGAISIYINTDYTELSAGTYTFSDSVSSGESGTTYFLYADVKHTDGSSWDYYNFSTANTTTGMKQTIPEAFKFRTRIVVRNGQTLNNVVFKPMLELGNQATTYEAYKGASYPISLGVENLFDKDNANVLDGMFINASAGNIGSNANATSIYIPINPNTTYCVSKTKGNRFAIGYSSTTPAVNVSLTNIVDDRTKTSLTSTSASDSKYLVIYISLSDTETYENIISTLQVEYGSKANSYTPFGTTPIELCKIGDYQDSIVKDNGKWYLNKQIGKVVLNGSEVIWTAKGTGGNNVYVYQWSRGPQDKLNVVNEPICCNYFKQITISQSDAKNVEGIASGKVNEYSIKIGTTASTTVEDFQTWLSTNKPVVYYPLSTPTYTEITDTTLQQQLNALEKAKSYNSQTNLTQTNDDISFIITATALESITNS